MNNQISLEKIKDIYGAQMLAEKFGQMLSQNKMNAINMINSAGISFSTFYLLMPMIKQFNLVKALNMRNRLAIAICEDILDDANVSFNADNASIVKVLEWMANSASYDDGIEDDFDRIIDVCYAMLLGEHKDVKMLKQAIDLAFTRNKKKNFNHDLIWAIFRTSDIKALELIAEYLKSENQQDVEFSEHLLENAMESSTDGETQGKYDNLIQWLKDNSQYINFTGECYNQASRPRFFNVDMENQYANGGINHFKTPMTYVEKNNLEAFRNLDTATKSKLSKASADMYNSGIKQWDMWKKTSINDQLAMLNKNGGSL